MSDRNEGDKANASEGQDREDLKELEKPYPLESCIACGKNTHLRCSPCGEPLCQNCLECPNGCDDPANERTATPNPLIDAIQSSFEHIEAAFEEERSKS